METENIEPDWTAGLTTRSKNALKGHGFKSKKEVLRAFEKNEIRLKKMVEEELFANSGKKELRKFGFGLVFH